MADMIRKRKELVKKKIVNPSLVATMMLVLDFLVKHLKMAVWFFSIYFLINCFYHLSWILENAVYGIT